MRIAYLVWNFPAISQPFILNQIEGAHARGHDVRIFALDGSRPPRPGDYPALAQSGLLGRVRQAPGILRSKTLRRSALFAPACRLLGFPGRGTYDIVHCQFGTLGLKAMELRRRGMLSGKLVVSFRGYDISSHVKKHGRTIYRKLLDEADYCLTNCQYFERRLLDMGCPREKLQVLASGLDLHRFPFEPRVAPSTEETVRIVTVGRLIEKKGIKYAIKAVALLAAQGRKIDYTIVGEGSLRKALTREIKVHGAESYIHLAGEKKTPDVISALQKAHIFVGPSVTAKGGDEDAPINTIKEAMALGLPVIGTTHGGIPELVEEGVTGFLVPERNPGAIAEKIDFLTKTPAIWRDLALRARAHVEADCDIERLNGRLMAIYEGLLR